MRAARKKPSAPRAAASEAEHARALNRMVAALPKSGSIVLVHSHAAISTMRGLIYRLRGRDIGQVTRVLSAPTEADEEPHLRMGLQVFRDPFVLEQRAHARALATADRV